MLRRFEDQDQRSEVLQPVTAYTFGVERDVTLIPNVWSQRVARAVSAPTETIE